MGYGDLQFFDIVVFAVIAIFLVFRLRKVLGRRTGLERNAPNDLRDGGVNIKEKVDKKEIPELSENLVELKKAYKLINEFDHNDFLNGAKNAFETIINAFNSGDKTTLKNLLNSKTLIAFEDAIDKNQNDPSSQIFSLNIKKIDSVIANNNKIIIKITFISEQYKNNDENTVVKKEDVWSFEKQINSKNPNWVLSST